VDLADDVFPETSFKKAPDSEDPYNEEKTAKVRTNIHLVHHGAIRLLTERDEDGDWVRSIEMNPSLLLYGVKRHPLLDSDLLLSLTLLMNKVTPLLADPLDACHIVPGLLADGEPIAYFSAIESEILLPDILLPCLHSLSHPMTGPAEGATKTRFQLGDKSDHYVISFTMPKRKRSGPRGTQGVRVKLILKGHALAAVVGRFGTTTLVKDIERLTAFPASAVARAHQTMMSRLEGTYLPVPSEWADRTQGKPVTQAKAIALVSRLTTIPIEELRDMDEKLRDPSKSTRQRLDEDVPIEANRLAPIPVFTLFDSAVYSAQEPGKTTQAAKSTDPQIAAAYGQQ